MYRVGKRVIEVDCPLCDTIYLLNHNEVTIKDWDEEKSKNGRVFAKIEFYCPDCNRNVIQPDGGKIAIWKDQPKYYGNDFAYHD